MSEETEITKLLVLLQEMLPGIRTLVTNQEKLASEQQHMAKAVGEIGLILRNQGSALVTIWRELNLPICGGCLSGLLRHRGLCKLCIRTTLRQEMKPDHPRNLRSSSS